MPISNLGFKHITPQQIADFDAALNTLITIAGSVTQNLTAEERGKYGSIQEKNKAFANAVHDLSETQPELRTPDIDWVEFEADYADRKFADTRADRISTLMRMITDFKIVHDYDNFQDSLTDYDYSKYKSTTNTPGFTEKVNYLKQFFTNTGGSSTAPAPAEPKA